MTKKPEQQKKIIQCELALDTSELYDSLPVAIKYLQEIQAAHPDKNLSINERWDGYEDMQLRFVYNREETDFEFHARLDEERRQKEAYDREQQKKANRERDLKEYRKLKDRLGL